MLIFELSQPGRTAHGSNPATAAMCGCTVREIPTKDDGDIDVEALKKETLDEFIDVMTQLLDTVNPQAMKDAPLTTPVRRLDDVKAARELDIAWQPPQAVN